MGDQDLKDYREVLVEFGLSGRNSRIVCPFVRELYLTGKYVSKQPPAEVMLLFERGLASRVNGQYQLDSKVKQTLDAKFGAKI